MLLLATKLIEKISDPSDAKEYYNSYLKRKNTTLVKRSKIISQKVKVIKNPSLVDIISGIIEYPKISHKLSKTIRQLEKVSQEGVGKSFNSHLYSEIKQNNFWMKKLRK